MKRTLNFKNKITATTQTITNAANPTDNQILNCFERPECFLDDEAVGLSVKDDGVWEMEVALFGLGVLKVVGSGSVVGITYGFEQSSGCHPLKHSQIGLPT